MLSLAFKAKTRYCIDSDEYACKVYGGVFSFKFDVVPVLLRYIINMITTRAGVNSPENKNKIFPFSLYYKAFVIL